MSWQKTQHHFIFFFLSFVLLAQSLIFVVSQAVPFKNYELKPTWFDIKNGQTLVLGQDIYLQASVGIKGDKNGAVYFVISDTDKNFVVNFETNKNAANVYSSLSPWHTADWPTGIYYISVRADIWDSNGLVEAQQESAPLWVKIISVDEYNKLLLENTQQNTEISASITSSPSNSDDNLGVNIVVPLDTKDKTVNTTLDTNTVDSTSTATSTNSSNTTSTQALAPDLALISPVSNSNLTSRNFLLRFLTNFPAETVSYEFINTDNAAISTGSISIDKTDAYNWVKNIELDDTFIDGDYKLLINVPIPNSETVLTKSFDYQLVLPIEIKPEDLMMTLVNLQSNIQGQIGLRADVNLSVKNLDFVIEDSVSHLEVLRIKGINNSPVTANGVSFVAVWDTAVLPNANYLVYVESQLTQEKVSSVKQLVTVYNPKNDVQSTSTPIVLDAQGGPNIVSTPTSTVSVVNNIASSTESSIDCERSGISDQNLCQLYQAELNDSVPNICLEQNIFNGGDCEKYVFANAQQICTDNKITDADKCHDYLSQKYNTTLQCDASLGQECKQLVDTQYIARLAYLIEQRNKYLASINQLTPVDLTINTLKDKLSDNNTIATNLSLVASDKKIATINLKNVTILDSAENLFISSPFAMMGDQDGDALPDDLESYYGTDPYNADTDGDGHNDGQEVLNNYNPLGEGKLTIERTNLDQVLLAKHALVEPRASTLPSDDAWQVAAANASEGSMNFTGRALANTWVNIFIYSDIPFLATTKSDNSGNWSYTVADPLTEGVHRVYVASNDKNGQLLARSAPVTFLVSNIQNDLAPVGVGQQVNVTDQVTVEKDWTIYYIIGGGFIFLVLLGVILLLIKRRRTSHTVVSLEQLADGTVAQPSVATPEEPATKESDFHLPGNITPEPIAEGISNIEKNNDQENRV